MVEIVVDALYIEPLKALLAFIKSDVIQKLVTFLTKIKMQQIYFNVNKKKRVSSGFVI